MLKSLVPGRIVVASMSDRHAPPRRGELPASASRDAQSKNAAGTIRLLAILAVGFAVLAASAGAQPREDAAISLRISSGKMTLKAENVALGEVLRRVARAMNAELSIPSELAGRTGYWDLREVPVADAVLEIARPLNVLVVQENPGARDDDRAVLGIYVFGGSDSGSGKAAPPAPVRTPRVVEVSRILAADADAGARQAAARELGWIGTEESVTALEGALGDADASVRVEAVEALGRIASNEAVRLVGQMAMGSRDPEVRAAALRVLEANASDLARAMLSAARARAQTPATTSNPSRAVTPGARE